MVKSNSCHFPIVAFFSLLWASLCWIQGCRPSPPHVEVSHVLGYRASIFPDYTDITIPVNIAPLNFIVEEEGTGFKAQFKGSKGTDLIIRARNHVFRIPPGKWSRLLSGNMGSRIEVILYMKENGRWSSFESFGMNVAGETIDPFLVYRLIPPGYETWSSMGLYQRDLTSFRERPVIENKNIQGNCVNCHSFCKGSSENMLFHIRGSVGGTMIKMGNDLEKIDLKREETISAGVYPSWHPSGNYIAFSTNKIEQYFHADPEKTIEVLDRHSDLILYNTSTQSVTHVPGTRGDEHMETFPCWSPDGTWLYFSRTDAGANTPFDSIRYDIYRIGFDPVEGSFGETVPVFMASQQQKSASFPVISPDGKYLLFTIHDYGTFPIWHREADLCLVDLTTGKKLVQEAINSNDADSYHTWSLNSRWVVFSSRRYDGRYTKPYISYLDQDGQFSKPFLLPQKDPGFYDSFFFSYNKPELIEKPVQVSQRRWIKAAKIK